MRLKLNYWRIEWIKRYISNSTTIFTQNNNVLKRQANLVKYYLQTTITIIYTNVQQIQLTASHLVTSVEAVDEAITDSLSRYNVDAALGLTHLADVRAVEYCRYEVLHNLLYIPVFAITLNQLLQYNNAPY